MTAMIEFAIVLLIQRVTDFNNSSTSTSTPDNDDTKSTRKTPCSCKLLSTCKDNCCKEIDTDSTFENVLRTESKPKSYSTTDIIDFASFLIFSFSYAAYIFSHLASYI